MIVAVRRFIFLASCLLAPASAITELGEFARLEADPVEVGSTEPATIRVWYYGSDGIDSESIGDGDVWVSSAGGFHAVPRFERILPLRRIGTTAEYTVDAPADGWGAGNTKDYAVLLAADEVLTGRRALPLSLTGVLKVGEASDDRVIAGKGSVALTTFPTPGAPGSPAAAQVVASLEATFPYPVDVQWGEPVRATDGSFTINVVGKPFGIVPQVVTTYRTRVDLGVLPSGSYTVNLVSGDVALGSDTAVVGSGEPPVDLVEAQPTDVDIQIEAVGVPGGGGFVSSFTPIVGPSYVAKVRLTYGGYVAEQKWGRLERDGNALRNDVSVYVDPRVLILAPVVIERSVFLGALADGDYTFSLTSFGQTLGEQTFQIDGSAPNDMQPPSVQMDRVVISEPGDAPAIVRVTFSDPSGLVIEGARAQELRAVSRRGEEYPLTRTDFAASEDDPSTTAIATYELAPMGGSWDAGDNGIYRIRLSAPDQVCDLAGNHLTRDAIGYLRVNVPREVVDPTPTPRLPMELTFGAASEDPLEAVVRLYVPDSLASRDDWEVRWGEPVLRGVTFFLNPSFVMTDGSLIERIEPLDTTGGGMWVSHTYELGEPLFGFASACLRSNLGHFGKAATIGGLDTIGAFSDWREHWVGHEQVAEDAATLWDFLTGLDPREAAVGNAAQPRPLVLEDAAGDLHFGLSCRRVADAVDVRMVFYGSSDLVNWVELGPDAIEEVSSEVGDDGIESFIVCLTESAATSEICYLRAAAERW